MDVRETCPLCGDEGGVEVVRTRKTFNVRGETIDLDFELSRCVKCGEEFINPKTDRDPLVEAYKIFRKRHNMVQPEQIKELRKRYGMTQGELSRILGWGAVTLSRYENGSLQDAAHDSALKLLRDPQNLLRLIKENPESLAAQRRGSLIQNLEKLIEDEHPIERYLEERFGHQERSPFTGFLPFDIDKFFNCILFFCREGLLRTSINKYVFYADFKHFKEYSIGITGAKYVHLPYGPVPNNYAMYLAALVDRGHIEIDEISYASADYVGERYTSVDAPMVSVFSNTELKILAMVKEKFDGFTAKALSEFSHGEKGYQETSSGQPISYDYATFLRV